MDEQLIKGLQERAHALNSQIDYLDGEAQQHEDKARTAFAEKQRLSREVNNLTNVIEDLLNAKQEVPA